MNLEASPTPTASPKDDAAARAEALRRSPTWLVMGFRPFFFVGSIFAVVVMVMWMRSLVIVVHPAPTGTLSPNLWHVHELLFGFAFAIITGFLLTATRNWTKRNTLHGYPLGALVALWLAGRVVMNIPLGLPAAVVSLVALAFPVAATLVLAHVVLRVRYKRGYGIVATLLGLTIAAVLAHAEPLSLPGPMSGHARAALHGATHLVVVVCVIIAGRVLPFFTRNKTGEETSTSDGVSRAAMLLTIVAGALATLAAAEGATWAMTPLAVAAPLAAVAHVLRMRHWATRAAMRVPMLAVLHVAYLWIPVGYLLLGVAALSPGLSFNAAIHALTIGLIASLILGMITRVTLGHTGREIVASRVMRVAFVCINLAAVVRLLAAAAPRGASHAWLTSGVLFCVAFLAYVLTLWRALLTPRPDGKPG